MQIKIDAPSHPYSSMTEDFLLRQASAELLLIEQSHVHAPDPSSALAAGLWNWLSEYKRYTSPPALARLTALVADHIAGKQDRPAEFFDAARASLGTPER